jgi:hypothetical protein
MVEFELEGLGSNEAYVVARIDPESTAGVVKRVAKLTFLIGRDRCEQATN